MMRTFVRPFVALAMLVLAAACSHHMDLQKPASQDNFGVQMAKMNLWREALFRFERAVEINPSDAMAHNNLAVAWEANGDFEKARKEYLEALRLDRTNQYIQKNYSRYVEFLSRNRKRQQKDLKSASTAPAAATPSTEPKATTEVGRVPGTVPVATEPVKAPPTVTPPSDLPPQPATPPQPKPPGGGR
jgi:Tfp pilus assembly protein PilF